MNSQTKEISGFKTFSFRSNNTVRLYLGGICQRFKNLGQVGILEVLSAEWLAGKGIHHIYTNISACAMDEVNSNLSLFSYKIEKSFFILRKVF